jgi:hypothetical protein
MRGFTKGTLLGKCQWCTQPIKEGDSTFTAYYARVINTKWYCAECLVALKPTVDELTIEKEYSEDVLAAEQAGNLDLINQKWIVEVGTGKIRRNPKYK